MLNRFTSTLAIAAVAATVLASAADAKSLDQIISDGVIRIGINPNFPNMSVRNDAGEWEGFDIDIGKAIAEKLGVEPEWVPTETAQRVPFLVSDRIDMSLGALTRNSERAKLIDYTVPLHTEVLAVLATDKIEGDSWKDFNKDGVTLANMNAPDQTVIAGPTPLIGEAEALLQGAGLTAKRLPVACGFHSDCVAPARDLLAEALQAAEIGAYADGVIVGSALVSALKDGIPALRSLTEELADGVRQRITA